MENTMFLLIRWNSSLKVEESDIKLFSTKQEAIQELKNAHRQLIKNMMATGSTIEIEENDLYEESYAVVTYSSQLIIFYGRVREISVEKK